MHTFESFYYTQCTETHMNMTLSFQNKRNTICDSILFRKLHTLRDFHNVTCMERSVRWLMVCHLSLEGVKTNKPNEFHSCKINSMETNMLDFMIRLILIDIDTSQFIVHFYQRFHPHCGSIFQFLSVCLKNDNHPSRSQFRKWKIIIVILIFMFSSWKIP